MLNGTAVIAEDLSLEERSIIGPWINRLMTNVGSSYWLSRQDNKAYMRAYYLALWGSIIGDVDLLNSVSERYKLAINDMRPDGSLPIDSSRSGMGLKYHSDSTRYLTAIAQLFDKRLGVDLHNYATSDGRSLDTLVGFAVSGMKNPKAINPLHAKPCPDGGDRWGGVDTPSTGYVSNMRFLQHYYLDLFPNSAHKSWLELGLDAPKIDEVLGFTARGLFAENRR